MIDAASMSRVESWRRTRMTPSDKTFPLCPSAALLIPCAPRLRCKTSSSSRTTTFFVCSTKDDASDAMKHTRVSYSMARMLALSLLLTVRFIGE